MSYSRRRMRRTTQNVDINTELNGVYEDLNHLSGNIPSVIKAHLANLDEIDSLDNADLLVVFDDSEGEFKVVTLADLKTFVTS